MKSEQFLPSVLLKRSIGLSAGALCVAMMLGTGLTGEQSGLDTDWPHYGGNKAGNRYSALNQINLSNVKDLEVAWM